MWKTMRLLLLFALLATSCRFSEAQRTALVHSMTMAILNAAADETIPRSEPATFRTESPAPDLASQQEQPAVTSPARPACLREQLANNRCPKASHPRAATQSSVDPTLPSRTNPLLQFVSLRPGIEKAVTDRICIESTVKKRTSKLFSARRARSGLEKASTIVSVARAADGAPSGVTIEVTVEGVEMPVAPQSDLDLAETFGG